MAGRPRNPNRPPTVTAVRLTEKAYHKLLSQHRGQEPYGMTLERVIDELEALRKKVRALELEKLELEGDLRVKEVANRNLIDILKRRDEEIDRLKRERRAVSDSTVQESI